LKRITPAYLFYFGIIGIVSQYPLTPAFRLGIKKIAVFSHEPIPIINQFVRAKAQNLLVV
jgi:hypothetical protein